MRRILPALLFAAFILPAFAPFALAQGAPPQAAANQPYTIEYYYKVQWGHQQEFLTLFLKNHYPLLKKIVESGRMTSVKIESPAYHTTEDGRWDYRVTIKYPNSTLATTANPDEESSSTSNSIQTRTLTNAKNSGGSRFYCRIGTYPLPT
jgi:hypothetical protein